MFLYDFKIFKLKFIKLSELTLKNQKKIFFTGFSTFMLSFLLMYIVNIPRYVIDFSMNNASSSIFGILIMPASVIVLIAQFILHPFLIKINNMLLNKNYKNFKLTIFKISIITFFLGILSTIVASIIGIPILEFMYGIELKKYSLALVVILLGATLYGITNIISNILIVIRTINKQILVSIIVAIISLLISIYLIKINGVNGACYSYLITMIIDFLLYLLLFVYSVKKIEKGKNENDKYNNTSIQC